MSLIAQNQFGLYWKAPWFILRKRLGFAGGAACLAGNFNFAEAIMKTNVQEQFIVDTKGKKTGVIIPLTRYQRLMEDLHDLAVVAERRAEAPVSLLEVKRRLRKDGIL